MIPMAHRKHLKFLGTAAATAAVLALLLANSQKVKAADDESESKIQRGFAIAPVHLAVPLPDILAQPPGIREERA